MGKRQRDPTRGPAIDAPDETLRRKTLLCSALLGGGSSVRSGGTGRMKHPYMSGGGS